MSTIEVEAETDPDVPEMVTVEVPVAAVALAVRVRMLLPDVGFVPKLAVTPLGRPDAERFTLPANPPSSVTEMVSVALPPGTMLREGLAGARVKPCVVFAVTVSVIVVLALRLPEVSPGPRSKI